jgi:hypothetical protein
MDRLQGARKGDSLLLGSRLMDLLQRAQKEDLLLRDSRPTRGPDLTDLLQRAPKAARPQVRQEASLRACPLALPDRTDCLLALALINLRKYVPPLLP